MDSHAIDFDSSKSIFQKGKTLGALLKSLIMLRKDIGSFYDIMTAPANKILDQFFESEPLKVSHLYYRRYWLK